MRLGANTTRAARFGSCTTGIIVRTMRCLCGMYSARRADGTFYTYGTYGAGTHYRARSYDT